MIDDRVDLGLKCMISSMALGSEITLGVHLIETLFSLHKIMFIQVVTFNSGAWDSITPVQMTKLKTVE